MKIPSELLRIYKSLHTWVGLTAGIFLFIGFFAGSLTVFKQPLERWATPPAPFTTPLSASQIDKLVSDVLAQYPSARHEFSLHLSQRENVIAPLTWSDDSNDRELDLSDQQWLATINDEDQIHVQKKSPVLLVELIDMLHRTAGIPGFVDGEYVGVYIMGVAAILYFLALVSGVILVLPTLAKDFLAVRVGKNKKRFWLDIHNVIGLASLPYHLVISLTAIVFAFHDQFYGALQKVVYRDQPMFQRTAIATENYQYQQLLPVSSLLAKIQQEAPEFQVDELLFMGLESSHPRLRAALKNSAYILQGPQSAYLIINPYTGDILDTSMLPTKANAWGFTTTTFFALHFGSYGGDWVRWIYFLLGLAGAFLFYSGNLLWIETRRKRQRNPAVAIQQNRNAHFLACATVGICLGSIIGVCVALSASKWFSNHTQLNSFYPTLYYSTFLLIVLWAFFRGAAKALKELLVVCSLSALAIPGTSLLSIFVPNLWAHTSAAALGVDITAFVIGMLFLIAAQKVARRIKNGPADSLWFARTVGSHSQSTASELAK